MEGENKLFTSVVNMEKLQIRQSFAQDFLI